MIHTQSLERELTGSEQHSWKPGWRQSTSYPSYLIRSHRLVKSFRRTHKKSNTGCVLSGSVVSNSAIPWTVARQAPLSVGFSRQEYWSGLPFPTPGDLPNPGIEPMSLPSMSLPSTTLAEAFFTTIDTGKQIWRYWYFSWEPWFWLGIHSVQYFTWCTLLLSHFSRVRLCATP